MARTVEVKVVGDVDGVGRAFKSAADDADRFGSKLSGKLAGGLKIAGVAALGLAGVVGGGLAVALKTGFGELQEGEAALAQSATLIENLGQKTRITTGDIDKWAGELQGMTGIPDDVIVSAENTLLRFDALAGDSGIFRRTAELAADVSVALGKDMPAAAQALGRALADPETAMGKLARMGVVLTEEQQKVIDSFIAVGDEAGATEYLLGLLEAKFGGIAEAAGDTTSGKIEILKRKFEDISEAIASKVMPFADRFIDWLTRIMDAGSVSGALGEIASGIGSIAKEIGGNIADFLGSQDWGHIGTVVAQKLTAVIEAVPWGSIVRGAGKLLWGALSSAFSAGVEILNEAGVGQSIRDWFERQFEDALDFVVPITDKFLGAIQAVLEGLGRLPDALGGAKFDDWAEDIGDAREDLREWNDELSDAVVRIQDVGDGFVSFEKVAQNAFDIDGIEGLASHLAQIEAPINDVTLATIAWAEAFGDVPDITQVQAVLEDDAAKAAIDAYIAKIGSIPEDSKTRAELLAQAARELADDLAAAIEGIPDSSTTTVTTPGADNAADDADRVADKVKGIPDSSRTHVQTTGVEHTLNQLGAVDRAAADVTKTVTVVQVGGGDLPYGTAGSNARGSQNWRGGWTMVGEEGPELVNLPRGSDIYPADDTESMLAGSGGYARSFGGGQIVVENINIYAQTNDPKRLAQEVRRELIRTGQRNGAVLD